MVRWLTCAVVVLLVACGGGSGGGGGPIPTLMSLFPIAEQTQGTVYDYDVTKRLIRGGVEISTKTRDAACMVGHAIDPSGPDTHYVGFPGSTFPEEGAAFMWTTRGLELMAIANMTFWGPDGICVSLLSPGVLLAPSMFLPGAVHSCDLTASPLDGFELRWIGPDAVAGHPDAQRFEFLSTAPYSQSNPAHPRFGATSARTAVVIHCAPDVGPVRIAASHQFVDGATVFEEAVYEATLAGVTPGP